MVTWCWYGPHIPHGNGYHGGTLKWVTGVEVLCSTDTFLLASGPTHGVIELILSLIISPLLGWTWNEPYPEWNELDIVCLCVMGYQHPGQGPKHLLVETLSGILSMPHLGQEP